MKKGITFGIISALAMFGLSAEEQQPTQKLVGDKVPGTWVELFNGKDLTGWTPKFKGYDAGVNYKDTFKVENGVLKVDYSKWDKWDGAFGHLFHEGEYSHYILQVTYRFVGEQVAGGPGWAWRNNGIMYHGQKVSDIKKDQDFPNSMEFQFLGGKGEGNRATGSLCTPGTDVEIDGKRNKAHVLESKGPTYHGDQWVTLEIEVRGDELVRHWADGKVIHEYGKLQLDDGTPLKSGTISVQAETHPIEFKSIRIKTLAADAPKIPLE